MEPSESNHTIEEEKKPKKGLAARFEEKIDQDAQDSEKANELVHQYQHAKDLKKKSVLEQETEKIVRE